MKSSVAKNFVDFEVSTVNNLRSVDRS